MPLQPNSLLPTHNYFTSQAQNAQNTSLPSSGENGAERNQRRTNGSLSRATTETGRGFPNGQEDQTDRLNLLLCVNQGRLTRLFQPPVSSLDDASLFRLIKENYEQIVGPWKLWMSLWHIKYMYFVKESFRQLNLTLIPALSNASANSVYSLLHFLWLPSRM